MRNKIGMLALIAAILFVSGCTTQTEIKIFEKEEEEPQKGPVYIGYGWSTNNDTIEAVSEACSSLESELEDPEYILLFCTVGYDPTVVLREVNNIFPNSKVYGGTSCKAVLTKDGYHSGEVGSLALLGVKSKNITFGVGGADMDKEASPKEAAKKAIREALVNAGKEGEIPKLVLITAAPGREEEILLGIEDVIGEVPIIGGSSADDTIEGEWKQFVNDRVYSNGISLTVVFTDLKIGFAYEAGYIRSEKQGVITKANGRVIYEIDNKSAAEVYNNWTGGIISEKLKTGGTVLRETTFYPLAKILTGEDQTIHYLSIHPLSVNATDKSLTVFAEVKEGEKIELMHGNWELLLNWAQTTPSKALINGNIEKGEGAFGLYTFCAGTMLAIPEEWRSRMPLLVEGTIGIPFIGTFTFGEQGLIPGVGNRHGNLVNSMIIFGQES